MIKVSVCITTYNVGLYISECLDSILRQKVDFNYEILIGDDHSHDNTLEIIQDYQKQYPGLIRIIAHSQNIGVNKNDYSLITSARGEYIAWCDGDDYWLDDHKLQKEVDFLDANPQLASVSTDWRNFEEETNKIWDTRLKPQAWETTQHGTKYIERLLNDENSGNRLSSLMYRRSVVIDFLKVNSDIFLKVPHLQNDFALLCILADKAPLGYIQDVTTAYRIRSSSLSHSDHLLKNIKYQLGLLHLYAHIVNYFKISETARQSSIRKPLSSIIPFCIINNNTSILREALNVCKSCGYRLRTGQKVMIATSKIPGVNIILRHLLSRRMSKINKANIQ